MCMVGEADECWLVYRARAVCARVAHQCGECHRQVSPGETYHYAFGVSRDGASAYQTCAHCAAAASWLEAHCGGWLHHGIEEDLEEHRFDLVPERAFLLRAIVGIRRRWRRFDGDGLMPVPNRCTGVV